MEEGVVTLARKLREMPMQTLCAAPKMLFALATALMLAGCVTATGTAGISPKAACAVWEPISWSKTDTDQTIREVKRNNARRDGFCEGK